MIRPFLLVAALLAATARPATAGEVHAEYTGSVAGLTVVKLHASVMFDQDRYEIRLGYRTAGLVGFLAPGSAEARAEGDFDGDRVVPRAFESTGSWRGERRRAVLDYVGATPHVRELSPPAQPEREPVPDALLPGTTDVLGAMAALLRQIDRTGRCDGTLRLFDGRRLSTLTARTVGREVLGGATPRPALRCDFTGVQEAGFFHGQDEAEQRRPRRGSAWIAPVVAGAPAVALRIRFEERWIGEAAVTLDRAW